MGRLLTWIAIAAIVYLAWRMLVISKRRAERSRGAPPAGRASGGDLDRAENDRRVPETIVQCAICGLHLPGSEAVFARGRVYCGAEHRDQDTAVKPPVDERSGH